MKKTEVALILITIIGLIIRLLQWPGGNLLMILCITLLSLMYFIFGFAFFNGLRIREVLKKESYVALNKMKIFGAFLTGIASSIGVLGILFSLMYWPGAMFNVIFGSILLSLISVIALIKYSNNKSKYYSRILTRSVSIMVIAIAFSQIKVPISQTQEENIENEIQMSRTINDSLPSRV